MAAGVCGREGCGLCGDVVGGSDARVPEGVWWCDGSGGRKEVSEWEGFRRWVWVSGGSGASALGGVGCRCLADTRGVGEVGLEVLWAVGAAGVCGAGFRRPLVGGAVVRGGVEPVGLGVAAVGSLGGKAEGSGW